MNEHAKLIERFYTAFAAKDAKTMGECYADDVVFSDPVFQRLEGERARAMWAMLIARGKDLTIEFSGISADEQGGRAHWDARYSFGPKKRPVLNKIDARFELRGGRIVRHVDTFDLWRWTEMALGLPGVLMGWTPMLQNKVRAQAMKGLESWLRGP